MGVNKKKQVPKDTYGNVGVRASLTNAGLNNDKIGYDGEYVTYNGSRLLKPEYEAHGVSYAKGSDINKAINEAYKADGINVVPIAQLAGSLGVPQYAARYENDNVYLGGTEVPAFYVSDGIAYGDESRVKQAAKEYRNDTGAKSYSDIRDDYDLRNNKIDRLLDAYLEREDWSYDPEEDPAYLAYRNTAQREGVAAYEDILGNMTARTGGMLNSAAVTAASAGYNNYLQSIQDKIPEFAQLSYERYSDERKSDLEDILSMEDISESRLSNDTKLTDMANEFNRQNAMDEFGRKNAESDLRRNILYTDLYNEIMNLDIENKQIENVIGGADAEYANEIARENYIQEQLDSISKAQENVYTSEKAKSQLAENIYRNAVVRGYFLPSEAQELGISPETDPVTSYKRYLTLGKVK